jgi:peptidoglycan hydrolase-like protein with peptidoglycan-binding domain
MVEEVAGMAVASVVAVAMAILAVAILVALPAMASQLTEERTVGTEVTTGTEVATGAAVLTGTGTEIPIRMIIRTTGDDGDYSDAQTSPPEVAPSEQITVAVQKELAKLGYYHGRIDGIVGPETRKAISWFQSVDKLSVSGRIDDPTLKALQIS